MFFKNKFYLMVLLFSLATSAQMTNQNNSLISCKGRIEKTKDNKIILISPASSVSFNFTGNTCEIFLQSIDIWEHHNYVCLELDGKYMGRLRIEKGKMKSYPILVSSITKTHHLSIYKATEAASGNILFAGTTAKLAPISSQKKKKIEFIGDSITCGAQNDPSQVPCDQGEYFDHHNAYLAYGPVVSRSLNVDFSLSSVSGIGIYRNWNDEHIDEPIMNDVYENLYLNTEHLKPNPFNYNPDLVSICLGTNDFSDGDHIKARLPFDEKKYITNYIKLIKMVYKHNPKARIVLLDSPMVAGDKNKTLVKCLKSVVKAFENDKSHKKIALFQFKPMTAYGCGGHPDIKDNQLMADQLTPFFKKILNEK